MNIFTLMGTILVDHSKAEESISKTGKSAEGLAGKLGEGLKKAAAIGAAAMVAIGTAAAGMAVKAVSASDECHKALNTLQTKTGATNQEMKGLKGTLLSIYGNNYGESFEDVAQAIASVKQQTGLAGQELDGFTTNALALRDTFEYEVTESTRAADMMMKQFGISGEEAFNLIAQGAQNGLDKNDNLLDSINEYSVHFAQLGLDAEDMFNMFSNGAQTGVFDIDKLGDAVKEFGIRVKDGTADEAFEQLGLNAEQLKKAFVEGGEGAEKAFKQVNEALANCDDKVLQNTLGVTMYGTMWEDMGAEAVVALSDMNGEFDKTKSTMESIKEIKYDSFGEAIAGIGRQLEANVLVPLGDSIMPLLNEFANWINEHVPEIQTVIEGAVTLVTNIISTLIDIFNTYLMPILDSVYQWVMVNLPTIQGIFSTVFEVIGKVVQTLVDNFNVLLPILAGIVSGFMAFQVISTVTSLFSTLSGIVATVSAAIASAGGVTAALGAAFAAIASPIAIAVAAITGIVAILVTLYQKNEEVKNALNACWEAIKTCFNSACEFIKGIIDGFIAAFTAIWTKYGTDIQEIIKAAWDYIGQIVKTAIDLIKDIFNVFSKAFQGDWKGCWEAVKELASNLWNNITDALGKWLDLLVKAVINIGHAMLEAGKEIFNKLWEGAKNVWETIKSWLNTAKQDPINTIKGIGSSMFSAGKEIFNKLLEGVKSTWSSIQSWVDDKVNWIKDKVTFWNNSNNSMSKSSVKSHAGGINSVPYDNYFTVLHKGERVLTASENNALNSQGNDSTSGIPQININMYYPQVSNKQDIKTISRQLKQQISSGDRALGL